MTVLCTISLFAQNYSKGDSQINLGIGFSGYYGTSSIYSTKIPPIELQYENFISDKISIGGFVGYSSSTYEINYASYPGNYKSTGSTNYLMFGGMGNYHFIDQDKFNAYAGAKLGYINVSSNDDSTYANEYFSQDYSGSLDTSGLLFGAHLGGRYFVSENIALNAELGYGIALIKVGVSFNF